MTVEVLWHNCSNAMHRRCVGSSGAEDPATKSSLLAFIRPSDRPTLPLDQCVGSSGAEDFILARLCLDSNWGSDRPTVSSLRSSDHPVLLSSLLFLCNSSDATKNGLSVHPTVPRVSSVYQIVWRLHRRLLYRYRRFIRRCLFFSFLARFWPLIFSF
jgi:hypothetical protein